MAFCTNCGAQVPDGTAFCTNCGRPMAAPQRPAPGAYAAPAGYPAPAPVRKKSKAPLILGIVAAVLVIGIVIGVLFLTGVLGGSKGPVGTWTLTYASDDDYAPGSVALMIDKENRGYAKFSDVQNGYTSTYGLTVTCGDAFMMVGDNACTYMVNGDTLSLSFDGVSFTFSRTGKPEKRSLPKAGTYTLIRATWRGEDETSEYGRMYFQLQDGGFGMFYNDSYTATVVVDKYSLTINGSPTFYTYDGSNITIPDGSSTMVFACTG